MHSLHPAGCRPAVGTYPRTVAQRTPYTERLSAAWWLWLALPVLAGVLAAEVFLGAPGAATWVPYLLLLPLTTVGLWWLGRIRVEVSNGELRVDDARLPLRYVASVTPLDVTAKRDLLGPYAEEHAFVIQRPWIDGAVRIDLDDPDDPTPYWLVSTRRPDALATAIREELSTRA